MRFGGIPFGFGGGDFGGFPGMGGMGQPREPTGPKTFNLYKKLGVTKDSSQSQIRKSYLKLSRKAHPDRGGDAKTFQELKEAYETLKDRKEEYDKYGDAILAPDWEARGLSTQKAPERKAPTSNMKLRVSLADLYNGSKKTVSISREVFMSTSTGEVCNNAADVSSQCSRCGGQGAVLQRHSPQPGYVVQQQVRCPACQGRGFTLQAGWRLRKKSEKLDVYIEKGSKSGDKIKFREKGDMKPGYSTGDACVVLEQVPHRSIKRKGADLIVQKEVSLADALCGFEFVFEHLDGRELLIKSSPGQIVADETTMKLSEEGMPVKGDDGHSGNLFFQFTIDFPSNNELTRSQQSDIYRVLTGRQLKRSASSSVSSSPGSRPRLGSAQLLQEQALRDKLAAFKVKLQNWRDGKLKRYDTEPSVKADRNKKYHTREGYVSFLDATTADKLDKERHKMQSSLSFEADLSTSPRNGPQASLEMETEDGEEFHFLDEVTKELFGAKTEEFSRGADESDSEDEGRGGGGAQRCEVQ